MAEKDLNKEQILHQVQDNIEQSEFVFFLNSCLKKWNQFKYELDIVACIINAVCDIFEMTEDELIHGKKNTEHRGLVFYFIKKEVTWLSFEIIADMFGRQKSYVHKEVSTMEFHVEKHKTELWVQAAEKVQKKLIFQKKNMGNNKPNF